jgi:beta-alanine degradation protein BauB
MLSRLLSAAFLAAVAVNAAHAQDPTKVAATHYHLIFENEHVQVLSVHYGPHEKSELHEHPGGVVVIVTGGHLKFMDESGKVTESYSKPGEARWYPARRHRVENVGDEPYNAVYVGLKCGAHAAERNLG